MISVQDSIISYSTSEEPDALIDKLSVTGKHLVHKRVSLDGTQRPRLKNMLLMRQEAEFNRTPGIFLTRARAPQGAIARYSRASRRAMIHWFLRGQDEYRLSTHNWFEQNARSEYMQLLAAAGLDVLSEAESFWTDGSSAEEEQYASSGRYWVGEGNEFFESRNLDERRMATARRN